MITLFNKKDINDISYKITNNNIITFSKNNKELVLAPLPDGFSFQEIEGEVQMIRDTEPKLNYQKIFTKKISGTYKSLCKNALLGLVTPFQKQIVLNGSGYRSKFEEKERTLYMYVGYSHVVKVFIPEQVNIKLESNGTHVNISSHNKELVGLIGSKIVKTRKRNAYKGTGVYYKNSYFVAKKIKKK